MTSGPREIPERLVPLLESGAAILAATRDGARVPECTRAAGVSVSADRRRFSIRMPLATSARAKANLEDNGEIAVTFSRPRDHHTVQLKGRVVSIREGGERDREAVLSYRARFAEELDYIGIPAHITSRLAVWPCAVVEVEVREIYNQDPGPRAGEPLAP